MHTSESVAIASAASAITPRVWKENTQSVRVHTHGCVMADRIVHNNTTQNICTLCTFSSEHSKMCLSSQMTQNSFSVFIRCRIYSISYILILYIHDFTDKMITWQRNPSANDGIFLGFCQDKMTPELVVSMVTSSLSLNWAWAPDDACLKNKLGVFCWLFIDPINKSSSSYISSCCVTI